jgi:tetratricopeptide (TPR) repeat protein
VRECTEWLDRLDREFENLRAAFHWSQEQARAGDEEAAEQAFTAASALSYYWAWRVGARPGLALLRELLSLPGAARHTVGRAQALRIAGVLDVLSGNYGSLRRTFNESLQICRELGDDLNTARALVDFVMMLTSEPCFELGDRKEARTVLSEAMDLFQRLRREREVHLTRLHLGLLSLRDGDLRSAEEQIRTALSSGRVSGGNWQVAKALTGLGQLALARGDPAGASRHFQEAIESSRLLNDHRGRNLCLLGEAARAAGDGPAAWAAYREALRVLRDIRDIAGLACALAGLAALMLEAGDIGLSLASRRDTGAGGARWSAAPSVLCPAPGAGHRRRKVIDERR